MRKLLFIIIILLLSGCGKSRNVIEIQQPVFTAELAFPVNMQTTFINSEDEDIEVLYAYKEKSNPEKAILDSLIITKEKNLPKGLNLSRYAQNISKELQHAGYKIEESKTKQQQIKADKKRITTLIKTYIISKSEKDKRYGLDYFFILDGNAYRISYTTDSLSHRKALNSELKKIKF